MSYHVDLDGHWRLWTSSGCSLRMHGWMSPNLFSTKKWEKSNMLMLFDAWKHLLEKHRLPYSCQSNCRHQAGACEVCAVFWPFWRDHAGNVDLWRSGAVFHLKTVTDPKLASFHNSLAAFSFKTVLLLDIARQICWESRLAHVPYYSCWIWTSDRIILQDYHSAGSVCKVNLQWKSSFSRQTKAC